MNVATRVIVVASTALAAYAEAILATPWLPPQSLWITIAIAVVIAIAGNRLRSIALPIVLSVMYVLPAVMIAWVGNENRSEEHTSELQSQSNLVCRLLLEKKNKKQY